MIYIKNGYLVNPATKQEGKANLLIKDNRIEKIEFLGENEKATLPNVNEEELTVIDATDCVVAPGLMDVHVHFRDPGFTYKEDILTGAKAAAKGGFTTVVLMANTKPVVDNAEMLQYVLEKGKETAIRVESCTAITKGLKGEEIVPMEELFSKGAAGFTDDGIPIMDEVVLREAMQKAKKLNVPLSLHEENAKLIANNGVNSDIAQKHFEIGGSPREAEIDLVKRDLQIALETGAILNVQHISTKEAVELVRQAKAKAKENGNNNIHAEATPHHFSLTQEAVPKYGTLAKMNPPLRLEEDRQAIIKGLQDGTIDLIATDHAPHSKEEKEKSITEAPSGIIGLETALSLGVTNLVQTEKLSMMQLLSAMTINPAKMYGLNRGNLSEGELADLVIFNPDKTWKVNHFESKSTNTPFLGEILQGVIEYTICDGKIAYQNI